MLHCLARWACGIVVARAGWEWACKCGRVPEKLVAAAGRLKYTDTKPLTLLTTHTRTVRKYSDSSRATPTHHTTLAHTHTRGLRIGPSHRAGLGADRGYHKT